MNNAYRKRMARGREITTRSSIGILSSALIGLIILLSPSARAQSFSIMPYAKIQFFDANGRPLVGGKVCSYQAGTTTPLATYSDSIGTLNTNPVTLDSSGRANIWLGTSAYKIQLQDSTGTPGVCNGQVIWTVDNIIANLAALLSLTNTWTAPQTFNAATTFNALATFNSGITSSGPNTLSGGGTLSGIFGGAPTFSGTPNFSSGFTSTTGSFSGQITSTVLTGTAPFVIASTTAVPNLNASLLLGCTWAIPCPIGSTTPNTGVFTTLQANTSLTLNGSPAQTGVQGTDTKLLSAGTVAGVGAQLCTDANGGATTTGCPSGFTKIQFLQITSGICTTSGGETNCTMGPFTWPSAFANTSYSITCTPTTITGTGTNPGIYSLKWLNKTTTNFQLIMQAGSASAAGNNTTAEIDCIGMQ